MGTIQINKPLTLAEVNKINGFVETGNALAEFAARNSFLDEAPWFPTTHGAHTEEFRAKSLGEGDFTRVNGGVPQTGSSGDIIKEPVRMYEAESIVDDRIIKFADDPFKARDLHDTMNLEGVMQGFNDKILYADPVANPDAIDSLSHRRSKLGKYCIDAGGSGTGLTSVWIMELSFRGIHLIYNKHGSPGLRNEDRGLHRVAARDGSGFYSAWIRHYEIVAGLVVGMEASLFRYCNLDPAAATYTGGDPEGAFNPSDIIRKVKPYLPTPGGAMAVIFAPRSIYGQIEDAAYLKGNANYTLANIQGFGEVIKVAGIPVRPWDAISENESAVA
jgi:hypothetical protein